jgi:hypothetical protein
MTIEFDDRYRRCGSLKRSLGMVSQAFTIPIPINGIGMRLPPNAEPNI